MNLYKQTKFNVVDRREHDEIVIPSNGTKGLRSERIDNGVLVCRKPKSIPANPVMDLATNKQLVYLAHRCMGRIGIRKDEVYIRFPKRKDANLFEKLCVEFLFIERSELVYFIKERGK